MSTMRPRRLAAAALAATAIVAVTAAPAGACGGLVGENGTIQLDPDVHVGRVPRRCGALRDVVRVHRDR